MGEGCESEGSHEFVSGCEVVCRKPKGIKGLTAGKNETFPRGIVRRSVHHHDGDQVFFQDSHLSKICQGNIVPRFIKVLDELFDILETLYGQGHKWTQKSWGKEEGFKGEIQKRGRGSCTSLSDLNQGSECRGKFAE